jgi:hypothetical protein
VRPTVESAGSWLHGLAAKLKLNDGGTEAGDPLWRRIIDRLSGLWSFADGIGAFIIIAGALYIGIVHGVWTVGAGLIIFEVLGMLNSFYIAHRQLIRN